MQGPNVICPLHHWDYDVRTGVSRWNQTEVIATYPVKVEGDAVMIDADAVPPKPRFKSEYLGEWVRRSDPLEHEMHDIHAYSRGDKRICRTNG